MNIFEAAGIIPPRPGADRLYTVRQERIKRDGSEYFTWIVPATAAAAASIIEVGAQFPRARKYAPLDFLEITNDDVVSLTLTLNNEDTFMVPAGTIKKITGKAVWTVGVTNDDAAATSVLNKIKISLRREPQTIDSWARRQ